MTEQFMNSTPDAMPSLSESDGLGPTLRQLREARRLTPAEVCMRLKFSQRQLNALENEQWDLLPQGMSLRGFVKNYARYLEADVDALLSMLENQVGRPQSVFVDAHPAAGLAPADISLNEESARRPWGWLIVILVLIFIAGFYAFDRGWIPDSWLVFDWLKSLNNGG